MNINGHQKMRGALLLVSLLLLGYLGFLLLNLYRSYDQLQAASIEQQQHITEKRALVLESFLQDRNEDMVDLADKRQLSAYFENLSLGMSLEYGLSASLNDLQEVLDLYRTRKQLGSKSLYQRILFVDVKGGLLASSYAADLSAPKKTEYTPYLADRQQSVKQYVDHGTQNYLVFAYPYLFKGNYVGHLLVWVNIEDLSRHFIVAGTDEIEFRNSLSLLHDRTEYLVVPQTSDKCRIPYEALPTPAQLKRGINYLNLDVISSKKQIPVMAMSLPLGGSPLHLASFVPVDRNQTTSPMHLVLTTGAVGLLILAGAFILLRSDLRNRLTETRLQETRLREEAVERQNRVLQLTADELKASKEWLTLALQGADLGLWDWRLESGEVSFNEQWAAMLGYRLDELAPNVSTWEILVHPDDMPVVQEVLQRHLSGETLFYETEHRCRTKTGEWRWILDRGQVAERRLDGTPVRMAGTHLDITDRKQAEEELRSMNNELERLVQEEVQKNREKDTFMLQQDKMASIGQLAAGVAHEINNPMGFIISNLGTLEAYIKQLLHYLEAADNAVQTEKTSELAALKETLDIEYVLGDIGPLLHESQEGADRVKQIVQDLKDFARVDEATIKSTDLNQCVRSTINIVRNELKYVAQLDLQLGEIPLVMCNPQQINQVITNLLVNAAQAIEGHGTISVMTWQDGDQAILTVADTGKGISQEVIQRIFEPFFTTKPVGKGTGLGLTISYDMVRKNGGEISVESELGKGTTFTVRLPLQIDEG
jgi:two-component system NtrC family sensor kinase